MILLALLLQVVVTVAPSDLSVIDGDSLRWNVPMGILTLGFPVVIASSVVIRIEGIDTPELRGKCDKEKAMARLARDYVTGWIDDEELSVVIVGTDKYGRILARIERDGKSLGDGLVKAGLARGYEGGEREEWC